MGIAEDNFMNLVRSITKVEVRTFPWLTNCFDFRHADIAAIFDSLNGDRLGLESKRETKLKPDAFLPELNCILEFDEAQHFTKQRELALSLYPTKLNLGFDRFHYISLCQKNQLLAAKKGAAGFRRPTADFPFAGGRHCQRAMFDTLRDILPIHNGLSPTRRVAEYDIIQLKDPELKRAEVLRMLGL
jgi:hypothetical protein